jgi:hypothetical protein
LTVFAPYKDGVKDVVAEGVKGVAKKGAEAVKNGADAAKQRAAGFQQQGAQARQGGRRPVVVVAPFPVLSLR